jgi:hypothetical protein
MSEITENLSKEQLQKFDIDSIKKLIDNYKKATNKDNFFNENNIDLDWNKDNLSIEEIKVIKQIKENEQIVNSLTELLNAVTKEDSLFNQIKKQWDSILSPLKEITKSSIQSLANELMNEWNIPDNETIIWILDKIQYFEIWEKDKEIENIKNEIKNSKNNEWLSKLKASKIIWEFTWLIWTSLYNNIQEKMIERVLWNKEWYNSEFLMWYNEKEWNFLVKISDFKKDIQSKPVEEWNSKALASYILYLTSTGKWNISDLQNPNIIWSNKLNELSKYWKNHPKEAIAKKILDKITEKKINTKFENNQWNHSNTGFKNIWNNIDNTWVINTIENIENFSKLFNNLNKENFDKIINNFNDINKPKDKKAREQFDSILKKKFDTSITILKNDPLKVKKFNQFINEKYSNTCPMWIKSELINDVRKLDYENKVRKLWLSKYSNWEQTAEDFLIDTIKKDGFCYVQTLKWLDSFKDKNWNKIELKILENALNTYLQIEKNKIDTSLLLVLWKEVTEIYNKEKDLFEKELILKKQLENETDPKKVKILKKAIKDLGNIKTIDSIWAKKSIQNAHTANYDADKFRKLNGNELTLTWIDNYLRQNSKKFLKVVNDLNIYWMEITDINALIESKEYLFIELAKHKDLNDDWRELLSILSTVIEIQNEQYTIKWEEEKIIIKTKEIKNKVNEYYEISNNNITKSKSVNISNSNNFNFNSESWIIKVKWIQESIQLNPLEKTLVENNPDTIENIINFYKTLDKIWLSKLWNIKDSIFKGISNVKWIWFKIDKDYLNENEIKIFLNAILKSVWEEEISLIFTIESFLSKIEMKNKTQLWWWEAMVNTLYEETYIENKFYNNFVNRDSWIFSFNLKKFQKSLNNTQKKSK